MSSTQSISPTFASNLHAERLVTFLQTARGEVFQIVDILTEDEARTLAHSQSEGGHERIALDVCKGRFAADGIHQQFAVQRKA